MPSEPFVQLCKYCKQPFDTNVASDYGGDDPDGTGRCDACEEDLFELKDAVAAAKDTREVILGYSVWKKTLRTPKDGFGLRLGTCETCGKLLLVTEQHTYSTELSKLKNPSERFCNRECQTKQKEEKEHDNKTV